MLKDVGSREDHGQQELTALKNLSRHELRVALPQSRLISLKPLQWELLCFARSLSACTEPRCRRGAAPNACSCSNSNPA